MLGAFAGAVGCCLAVLVVVYWRGGRGRPWVTYDPRPAWVRAGIYFCCCYLLSYLSGGMRLIVTSPVVTSAQLHDPRWVAATALVLTFIVVAYSFVWVRYTVKFDRARTPLVSGLFGLLWGTSSGQLFLAVWVLAHKTSLPVWGATLVAYLVLAAWQPNFHNIYWDHYIAPEHDTSMTQKIKALGCHIPNLALTLTYLTVWHDYLVFVSFQVVACVSAAVGMRFPAPWATPGEHDFARRTDARVPRCTGYVSPDPYSDPYTPFYPGWKPAAPQASAAA